MAFDINAHLRLAGVKNVGQVITNLRKQLHQGLKVNIDLNVARGASTSINNLNARLIKLNTNLLAVETSANKAAAAIGAIAAAFGKTKDAASGFGAHINNNVNKRVKDLNSDVGRSIGLFEKFANTFNLSFKRFSGYVAASTVILGFLNLLRKGISDAANFEKQMVRLAQVGTGTTEEIRGISNEITRLSTSLGVSSKELSEVAVTLRQAGLSAKDVKVSLEAIAKSALAPNFDSMKQTVEGAIAVFGQFGIQAKDLEKALGSINAVAGAFAVEAGDIIEAIRRAGGSFATTGGQLEEFQALFTSVRATTRQSAETIATGLRTIFTRLQRPETVSQLKDLGVQLRFTAEEAERLGDPRLTNQYIGNLKAIQRIGQALQDVPPTSERFAKVVEQIGGYRQIDKVIPLLRETKLQQEALNVALAGNVSLTTDAEKAQQALLVRLKSVAETFDLFFRTLLNNKAIQTFINQLAELTKGLANFLTQFQELIPIFSGALLAKGLSFGIGKFAGFTKGLVSPKPIARFASGGIVPGQGNSDSVLSFLQPGEYVVNKQSAKSIGYGNLAKMARKANGGPIEQIEKLINSSKQFSPYLYGLYEGLRKHPQKDEIVKQLSGSNLMDFGYQSLVFKTPSNTIKKLTLRHLNRPTDSSLYLNPINYQRFDREATLIEEPFVKTDEDIKPTRSRRERILRGLQLRSFGENNYFYDISEGNYNYGRLRQGRANKLKVIDREAITPLGAHELPGFVREELERHYGVDLKDLVTKVLGNQYFDGYNRKYSQNEAQRYGRLIQENPTGQNVNFYKANRALFTIQAKRAKFAQGGRVPTLLTPGEFVFDKESAQRLGPAKLGSLNRYVHGGRVEPKDVRRSLEQISKFLGTDVTKLVGGVDLVKDIQKGGQRGHGFFSDETNRIRLNRETIKNRPQLDRTLSHEIAHAIHKKVGNKGVAEIAELYRPIQRRLIDIGADKRDPKYLLSVKELFANAISRAFSDKKNPTYDPIRAKIPELLKSIENAPIGITGVSTTTSPVYKKFQKQSLPVLPSSIPLPLVPAPIKPIGTVGSPRRIIEEGPTSQLPGTSKVPFPARFRLPVDFPVPRQRKQFSEQDILDRYQRIYKKSYNNLSHIDPYLNSVYQFSRNILSGRQSRFNTTNVGTLPLTNQQGTTNLETSLDRYQRIYGKKYRSLAHIDPYLNSAYQFSRNILGSLGGFLGGGGNSGGLPPINTEGGAFGNYGPFLPSRFSGAGRLGNKAFSSVFNNPALFFGAGFASQYAFPKIESNTIDEIQRNASENRRSSAITGALYGGGAAGAVSPILAPLGILVGGLVAYNREIENEAKRIKDIKFAEGLEKLGTTLSEFATGAKQIDALGLSDLNKSLVGFSKQIDEQLSEDLSKPTGIFGSLVHGIVGDRFGRKTIDPEAFASSRESQFRQKLIGELPKLLAVLNESAKNAAKSQGTPEELFKQFNTEFSDIVLSISRLGGLSKKDIDRRFRDRVEEERINNQLRENQKKGDIASSLEIAKFDNFQQAIESAGIALEELTTKTNTLGDFLDNQFSLRGRTFPGITQIGGPNKQLFSGTLGTLTAPLSQFGQDIFNQGREFDSLLRDLPQILSDIIGKGIGGKIEPDILLENRLRGEKISEPLIRTIVGNFSELLSKGKLLDLASEDVKKLAVELIGKGLGEFNSVINELAKQTEAISADFVNGLKKNSDAIRKIGELTDLLPENQLRQTLFLREREAKFRGIESGSNVTIQELLRPFNLRQNRLSGGLGPEGIKAEVLRLRGEIQKQESALPGASIEQGRAIQTNIQEFQRKITDLNQALDNLADTTQRLNFVQDKLREIDEEREARLGLGKRLLTSSPQDLQQINRQIGLAFIANRQQNLRGFDFQQNRELFDFLDSLKGFKIRAFGGEINPEELQRTLIRNTFKGLGVDIDLPDVAKNKEAELEGIAARIFAEANQAILAQRDLLQNAQRDFFTQLNQNQTTFLDRLQQNLKQGTISTIETQRNSTFAQLGAQRTEGANVNFLRGIVGDETGLKKFQSSDTLKLFKDLIEINNKLDTVANADFLSSEFRSRIPGIKLSKAGKGEPLTFDIEQIQERFKDILSPQDIGSFTKILNENFANYINRVGLDINTIDAQNLAKFNDSPVFQQAMKRIIEISSSRFVDQRRIPLETDKSNILKRLAGLNITPEQIGQVTQNFDRFNKALSEIRSLEEFDRKINITTQSLDFLNQKLLELRFDKNAPLAKSILDTTALIGALPRFASGGVVGKDGKDRIPAMVSNGEFIVNAKSSKKYRNLLGAINDDSLRGFAEGGLVGSRLLTPEQRRKLRIEEFLRAGEPQRSKTVQEAVQRFRAVGQRGFEQGFGNSVLSRPNTFIPTPQRPNLYYRPQTVDRRIATFQPGQDDSVRIIDKNKVPGQQQANPTQFVDASKVFSDAVAAFTEVSKSSNLIAALNAFVSNRTIKLESDRVKADVIVNGVQVLNTIKDEVKKIVIEEIIKSMQGLMKNQLAGAAPVGNVEIDVANALA